jgi:S-adenosylmethionine decarboxylase
VILHFIKNMKKKQTTNTEYPPGKHLLLDFWEASGLSDIACIESAMRSAAMACGATVLEVKLHQFGENGGITGVALLAESHISIHTWPEISYAALDVFVCGACDAEKAVEPLKSYFRPSRFKAINISRGVE